MASQSSHSHSHSHVLSHPSHMEAPPLREPHNQAVAVALLAKTRRTLDWLIWFDFAVMFLVYVGSSVLHMIQGQQSELDFLEQDIVRYNFRTSICDLLVLGPFRTTVLYFAYVRNYNQTVLGIGLSTGISTAGLFVKCIMAAPSVLLQWPAGSLIVANFLFTWSECYLVISRRTEAQDVQTAHLMGGSIQSHPTYETFHPYSPSRPSYGRPPYALKSELYGPYEDMWDEEHANHPLDRPARRKLEPRHATSPTAFFSTVSSLKDERFLAPESITEDTSATQEIHFFSDSEAVRRNFITKYLPDGSMMPGSDGRPIDFVKLADNIMQQMVKVMASPDWVFVADDSDVRTYKIDRPGKTSLAKGVGEIPQPAWKAANFSTECAFRKYTDDTYDRTDVIKRIDKFTEVYHDYFHPVWPTTGRDTVYLRTVQQKADGTCISVSCSVDIMGESPSASHVRAAIGPCGFIFTPLHNNTACKVEMMIDFDVGGNVPNFVLNKVLTSRPLTIAKVRDKMKEMRLDDDACMGSFTPGEVNAASLQPHTTESVLI